MIVVWNGTPYYYVTSFQGDVQLIMNLAGEIVVSYVYDAWGNIVDADGSLATTLGALNPLRYRGYVYDTETGLYYLQTRYYNPKWGRFINADVFVSTGQGLLGNNMFAYCQNSPISYIDPTGTKIELWSTLFEDHDPGFIHRAVQNHIILNGLIFKKELYLAGIGRADIYDPGTGEIWEIKHGGSTLQMQSARTNAAINQVARYVDKAGLKLQVGHANAFNDSFIINSGNISYSITYGTPQPGVILYYVQQLKQYEPSASYVYVPVQQRQYKENLTGAILVGAAFLGLSYLYDDSLSGLCTMR